MKTIDSRVKALRNILKREGIDAWIITGTDPHESEYVCPRWRTREWISGFTGSAGTVVITHQKALLWADSRYYIQAAQQIKGTEFELMKFEAPGVPDYITWLEQTMKKGSVIGVDASTMMVSKKRSLDEIFSKKGISCIGTPDFLEELWEDRPPVPAEPAIDFPLEVAGYSRGQKLEKIRSLCKAHGATHTFIASLDDIAWILNLRGSDVEGSPVFLSYLLIGPDDAWLFTDPSRFHADLTQEVAEVVEMLPYDAVPATMSAVLTKSDILYWQADRINLGIQHALPDDMIVLEGRNFSTDLKATKNEAELEGMRRAHLLDGVALVNFMAKLPRDREVYDEVTLAKALYQERMRHKECLDVSFDTIAGFNEHGAMPHYSATEKTAFAIKPNGLLVLDSGGMYETGTTDITRTLLIGQATEEQKRDYTLVLKGNLALAAQMFPMGTCGYQLDAFARQFLWDYGMNYFHGTGHGVGSRLNVHEGPQSISPKANTVELKPGMVISDEPGIYKEGRYGIRIENLVAVMEAGETEFGKFLAFETLTLCPFEYDLIDVTLLTEKEQVMVNEYHRWVYEELKDLVDSEAALWLEHATRPL